MKGLRWTAGCWLSLIVLSACQLSMASEASQRVRSVPDPVRHETLLEQLQQGRLIIVLRNASVDRANALNNIPIGDCVLRFSLSPAGREQALRIGQALQQHNIPVGMVYTSVSCHAREMAQLAFGKSAFHDGLNSTSLDGIDVQLQVNALRGMISQLPDEEGNTVLITHGQNISVATGIVLTEGEALILRPDGYGGVTVVARITSTQWVDLR